MKILVFAGGSGKRFWPLSRKNYPKQFQPIIDGRSTIELMVGRLAREYDWNNILIPTTERLVSLVKRTFPNLPTRNIFTEPTRRDLGPAVGLAMVKLRKMGSVDEPVTILWSDNFPADGEAFLKSLNEGKELIKTDPNRIILLGEKPTFPNENLGWIELGDKVGGDIADAYIRKQFKYRPTLEKAKEWMSQDTYVWNTGYFITTPRFVLGQYKTHNPKMYEILEKIEKSFNTSEENDVLDELYPQMEPLHFDNVVLENLKEEEAVVLKTNFKWSDPGTLYALKQFLQEDDNANVTKGKTYLYGCRDSLVYNFQKDQLVAGVGLDGFIVVNMEDTVLVCPKDEVGSIKKMLEEWSGDSKLEALL